MSIRHSWLGVVVVLNTGCALTTTFVPVEGPMSAARPVQVIQARAERGGARKITFVLPDGDPCAGRWASTGTGGSVNFGAGSLMSQYGTVYLSGYSVSSGRGQASGQALATCTKGNVFQIEFVAGSSGGFGIAKDRDGNVYRFVF